MLDEETVKIVSTLQKDTIELFFKMLFKLLDRENQRSAYNRATHKEKTPKIKTGELSEKEYNKMLKGGEKFRMVNIPKEKLAEIEKFAKQLGASYYVMEGDNKTALVSVSEKSFQQFDDVVKQSIKTQISADKGSVEIMDGNNLIPADQLQLTEEILAAHDIPAYTFQNKDGSCLNVVPKEYSGQYKAAIQEVKEAAEAVKNVEVTAFSNTGNSISDNSRFAAISENEAQKLVKNFGQNDMEFYKNDNGTFVKYPVEMKESVEKVLNTSAENKNLLKGFDTAVVKGKKDFVTIDKASLGVKEVGSDFFMKIPRTMGQDHLRIPQKDFIAINDGKTLKYSFDKEKQYDVLDSDGKTVKKISGEELAKHYENRSEKIFGGENTQTVHYDVSGENRIEVYDKSNDKLISVGTDNADKLTAILLENGIDSKAAEAVTEKVHSELGMLQEEKIIYSEENIEKDLHRSEVMTAVENMEQFGRVSETAGEKCAVYDKERKQYTVIDPKRDSNEKVRDSLIKAGYNEIQTAAIMSKLNSVYNRENIIPTGEKGEVKNFDSKNAELNNYRYAAHDGGVAVVKAEKNDRDEEVYKYVTAAKGTTRSEFEAALRKNFAEDEKTVTDIMKCLDNDKLLPVPEQIIIPSMGYKVSLVSSQTYEISKNGVSLTAQKSKADISKTAEAFGISEKQAERLTAKVEKSMNAVNQKPTFLSQLRQAKANVGQSKDNGKERDVQNRTESGAR